MDALAYVLNPDYASSTASLVTPYVAGADDYYNYCVYRNNANNGTVAEDGTTYAIDANGTVTAAAADGTTTEYPAVDFSTVGQHIGQRIHKVLRGHRAKHLAAAVHPVLIPQVERPGQAVGIPFPSSGKALPDLAAVVVLHQRVDALSAVVKVRIS